MNTVLCLGEALIDVVHRTDGDVQEHVGGSPLNVGGGLSRLGHPARLACWIGRDPRGLMIQQWLSEHAVLLAPGSDRADGTPTATATLDSSGAATYEFDLEWDLPDVDLDDVGHVHTGSIAAVLQPGADKVLQILEQAKQAGITISYDPNMRPALMGTPEAVRQRVEQVIALSDVVKASDEDIAWLYPDDRAEDVLLRWGQLGPRAVVMTRGGEGASFVATGGLEQVSPRRVDVVDTVGAGDSFMAGLVSGLLDAEALGRDAGGAITEQVLRAAIDRAVATSAVTVTHAGAYAPTRDEL